MFDKDKKGFITIVDVQGVLQVSCPVLLAPSGRDPCVDWGC